MNTSSLRIAILLLFSFAAFVATASGQNAVPEASWQQYPEGISTALTLTSKTIGNNKRTKLTLHVKNTSSSVKAVTIVSDGGGVSFSVQPDNNNWRPLRSHGSKGPISAKEQPIMPGATWSYSIELSPGELALVKAHPIQCGFALQDWSLKQTFPIQSSPQQLSESVEK